MTSYCSNSAHRLCQVTWHSGHLGQLKEHLIVGMCCLSHYAEGLLSVMWLPATWYLYHTVLSKLISTFDFTAKVQICENFPNVESITYISQIERKKLRKELLYLWNNAAYLAILGSGGLVETSLVLVILHNIIIRCKFWDAPCILLGECLKHSTFRCTLCCFWSI